MDKIKKTSSLEWGFFIKSPIRETLSGQAGFVLSISFKIKNPDSFSSGFFNKVPDSRDALGAGRRSGQKRRARRWGAPHFSISTVTKKK